MLIIRREQAEALAKSYSASLIENDLKDRGFSTSRDPSTGDVLAEDPKGATTRLKLDSHGRLKEHITPTGKAYRYAYDDFHQLRAVTLPSGFTTSFDYDGRGRLTGLQRGPDQRWKYEWSDSNDLLRLVFPDGSALGATYSSPGQIATYTDRSGQSMRFGRRDSGEINEITDASGRSTVLRYGSWNRPATILRPGGTREDLVRDSSGRVLSSSINGDPWATVEYDEDCRVKGLKYCDKHFVAFNYDKNGKVTEARNSTVIIKRRYDAAGRLILEDQGGQVIQYEYDASGLLTRLVEPSGTQVQYGYDGDGRLTEIVDWNGGRYTIQYDDTGNRVTHLRPNGVADEAEMSVSGRVEKIRVSSPRRKDELLHLQFGYNEIDQVSTVTDSRFGTKRLSYDSAGQLLRVQKQGGVIAEEFSYDGNGNITSILGEPAELDEGNRTISVGATVIIYDARGNIIEVRKPDGTSKYEYNGQNQLTCVTLPDGRIVNYGYDAFGRRIFKTIGGTNTRYIWACDQLTSEVIETEKETRRIDYLFVPSSFCLVAMRVNGEVFQVHSDHLGSPQVLSNHSAEVAWSGEYAAYGSARVSVEFVRNPFRLPGQYFDEETGLHYNRARYYAPSWGRYLSRDPLEIVGGINAYSYANNDPFNQVDAYGLMSFWQGVAAGAAVVAGAAILVVAAPIVVGGILAVAAGGAISAGVVAAAVAVVGGAALVGAGIGVAVAPEGCLKCQIHYGLRGAVIGAGAAITVMSLGFSAALLVAGGGAAGGLALAGGGTMTAGVQAADAALLAAAGTMAAAMTGAAGSGGGGDESGDSGGSDKKPKRVTNPKHNQNSSSPEPKNVDELYEKSIEDSNGVRWAKDDNGVIHRFSKPSNGETHWNGSTAGSDPIQEQNIPNAIRKALK